MKQKNKLSVAIGIPAYNEEKNITSLLSILLSQKQQSYYLERIIVVTDGSIDKTPQLIKNLRNPLIKLIQRKKRSGQQICQNLILKSFKGDVLVIIEADTLPQSTNTIDHLVKPFAKNPKRLGMVVGNPEPINPQTLYETILYHATATKKKIFQNMQHGLNVYICTGQAMKALSYDFASKLRYPVHIPEDAYTYLKAKEQGFEVKQSKKAKVFMKNVTNLSDRLTQHKKFIGGKQALLKHFDKKVVIDEYKIPHKLLIKIVLSELVRNPFWTLISIFEAALCDILTVKTKKFNALHKSYPSSKILISNTDKLTNSIG